ncbi:hypothetical protein CcaverHIS641_0705490 [Cutaneotrichosporon cavernicola]|nr:hypothetical protein CcaverHIS641_0705490 [Cutaneotrichosporon cavernicola]
MDIYQGSTTSISSSGSETSFGSLAHHPVAFTSLSRSSSRLSTNTFGFTRPNSPLMSSEAESWRTAHQSPSQVTITTSGTLGDDDYLEQPDMSPVTIGDDDYLEQPDLSPVTTPTSASRAHSYPTYVATSRVASMPELSRSTSTVNPTTPSTIYFPRMDHQALSSLGSRRSMSMSSLKETLADEEKAAVIDQWQHERIIYYDDRIQWEDINVNGKEVVADQAQAETNAPPAWTTAIPTRQDIRDAAGCHLIDEWGNTVRFGDMLPGGPAWRSATVAGKPVNKVLALFVGHWWCGLCHDYALVSVAKLSPAALIREGVRVVIVSSGSWKVISKYRQLFDIKFPVFVDNGTRLYRALGLARAKPNPFTEAMVKDRPAYHQHAFMRQMATGMARGIFQLGGIKLRNPGSFTQLGGEFVFGLDYTVDYFHRMQGRGDHCEAPEVLSAVGIQSTLGAPVMNSELEQEREFVRRRIRAQ